MMYAEIDVDKHKQGLEVVDTEGTIFVRHFPIENNQEEFTKLQMTLDNL